MTQFNAGLRLRIFVLRQRKKHCFKNGYGILRYNKEEIRQFCQSGIFVFNLMPGVY